MMTRYESVAQAVIEELERHKLDINGDPHLRSLQIVVELDRGSATISASIKSSRPRRQIQGLDARNLVQTDP